MRPWDIVRGWLGVVLVGGACAGGGAESLPRRDGSVRVEAEVVEGRLIERLRARRGGEWVTIAEAAPGGSCGAVALRNPEREVVGGKVESVSREGGKLVERMKIGEGSVVRTVEVLDGGPWVSVTTRLEPSAPLDLYSFADSYRFEGKADWCYSPSVWGYNPSWCFKAPLVLAQGESRALGIVPDLGALSAEGIRRCDPAITLHVPSGPLLSAGFIPSRRIHHAVFAPDVTRTWKAEGPVENRYFLFVSAEAEPGHAYREAVRLHWRRFGRRELPIAAAQQKGRDRHKDLTLWDEWRKAIWDKESPEMWLKIPMPDGSTGGGVQIKRWGGTPSVYLSAWFNALRTSFGMALYARRTKRDDLMDLARQTLTLALRSPGVDGAFKCFGLPSADGKSVTWGAGDGSGGSTQPGFLGYDMSWTAYWMLRWRAAGLPGGDEVVPRCRKLAEFLLSRQRPDGMLPTRFREDGSVQEKLSELVKAETAPVVLFLLALHAQSPEERYLHGALRGLEFLERDVIPKRQWFDFETFFSCSPRDERYDEITAQWPANNLALTQAVASYLEAYRITRDRRLLEKGEALLDYLLLFQQCWTNPLIEDLSCPAMLIGGFTTQNSDAEWSDARQSQCGNLLLDYYRETGKVEYLERGICALRAQFPVSPSENWAHLGYGRVAGVSSFHWGSGSGMAGIEIEEEFLRDAFVDLSAGVGVGVNGLDLTGLRISDGSVEFTLTSPFSWARKPVVVVRGTPPGKEPRIVVNGEEVGTFSRDRREAGIQVPMPRKP